MLATSRFTLASVCGMLIIPWALTAQAQEGLRWERSLDTARQMAAASNRLLLLHFWDEGCQPCVRLERNVFSQPAFGQALSPHYVAVKVKMSDHQALVKQYDVTHMPMDVVTTPRGQLLFKAISPQDGQQYVGQLMQVAFNVQRGTRQAALPTETSMNAGNPAATMPPTVSPTDAGTAPPYNSAPANNSPYSNGLPPSSPPLNATPASSPSKPATTDDRYADYYARRHAVNPDVAPPLTNSAPLVNNYAPPANNPAAMAVNHPPLNNPSSTPTDTRYPPPGSTAAPYAAQTNPGLNGYSEPANTPMTPSAQPPLYANQPPNAGPATPTNPYAGIAPPAQNNVAPQQPFVQQPVAQPNPSIGNSPYANQNVAGPSMQTLPPLPAGSPPLGLDGYCPVTLTEKRAWTKGMPQWGAIHRGRTYLFISQVEQQKFLGNPDVYSPMLSGNDPVVQFRQNQHVSGRREFGVFYNNHIYLFSSEATLNEFSRTPQQFDAMIIQAMNPQAGPR